MTGKLMKNFPAVYRTLKFIPILTKTHHCAHPEPDASSSNPHTLMIIIIIIII
jgi:hypothetical protein